MAELGFLLFELSRGEYLLELVRHVLHDFVLRFELFLLLLEDVAFLNNFLLGLAHDFLFPALLVTVAPFLLTPSQYLLPQLVQVFIDFVHLFQHLRTNLELPFVSTLAFEVEFLLKNDGHLYLGNPLLFLHQLVHLFLYFLLLFL